MNKGYYCAGCGYDLRGLPGEVCPECGNHYSIEHQRGVLQVKFRGIPFETKAAVTLQFAVHFIIVVIKYLLPMLGLYSLSSNPPFWPIVVYFILITVIQVPILFLAIMTHAEWMDSVLPDKRRNFRVLSSIPMLGTFVTFWLVLT